MYHIPVLLNQSIEGLNIKPNGTYVDTTFGGGGHSKAILEKLENGRLIGFDQDGDAVANKPDDERFIFVNQNFRYLSNFLHLHNAFPVDGILADLGVSSHQIDVAERGFSSRFEGNLDMRMNQGQSLSAFDIINNYPTGELIRIFKNYGELKNSNHIAKTIVRERDIHAIKTTSALAKAVETCFPTNKRNKNLAMIFQALRIEINDELKALEELLTQSTETLRTGGRLVIIAYHSLEDRLVKNFMKTGNTSGELVKDFYGNSKSAFKMITRKPIVPDEPEIKINSRARSARLRIAEKI